MKSQILCLFIFLLFSSCDCEDYKEKLTKTEAALQQAESNRILAENKVKELTEELIESEKTSRIIYLERIISEESNKVFNEISPLSGEEMRYTILERDYDYDTKLLTIKFKTTWKAFIVGPLFENYKSEHAVTALATLNKDNKQEIEILSMNDVLIGGALTVAAFKDLGWQ